ncbi:MAG: hypothetical protein WCV67_06435 [Victivallaceae bacterium]|jgi:hypothetical protein
MNSYSSVDYKPAPFWFLNHKLEKAEICRQIKLMHEAGVSGFFMHPRAGLKTPYGSDEWFNMIGVMVDEAEKLGMQAWLYDEDPFPSGPAGGRVFFENPEFAARQIRFYELTPDCNGKVEADIGDGRILEALAVKTDASGNVMETKDITGNIGMIRPDFFMSSWDSSYYIQLFGKTKFPHFRAETFNPHLQLECRLDGENWKVYISSAETIHVDGKYGLLPDNLNPECVKLFLELTHEKYRKHFGAQFGKTIPGIFTDETSCGGSLPWTPKFNQLFKEMHGYELPGKYYHLFRAYGQESRKVRCDFWATVHRLFTTSFFEQVGNWCRENSLELCGHLICEEDPLVMVNVYDLQKHFGIPGFDHITFNIPNGEFSSLNLGGKLVSSAALQQGKNKVLSECFGCNPFNFGIDGMKKIANWLYSLGITWLVPHGFFYSYDGYRKYDAGKSFFFQDEEFPDFKQFATYAQNTGYKLGESKSLNHVCILFPITALRSLFPAERELAEKLRAQLYDCVQMLLNNHVQFDLADEATLCGSRIEAGKIHCGRQQYDTVINLSPASQLLSPKIQSALSAIRAQGIKIIESPAEIIALPQGAGIIELAAGRNNIYGYNAPLKYQWLTVKENNDGVIVYIFNNNAEPGMFDIKFSRECAGAYLYDASTDAYAEIVMENGSCSYAAGGFEAVILEFRKAAIACPKYQVPEDHKRREYAFETAPEWDYTPPGDGWLAALHRWNIRIKGGHIAENVDDQPFSIVRDIVGTELPHMKNMRPRPIFDRSRTVSSIYPLNVEFSADFSLTRESFKKELLLVFENDTFSGDYRIFINDKELNKHEINRSLVYDAWNLTANVSAFCLAGKNNIRIVWEQAGEFDGLRSSIYIKAD